MRRVNLQAQGRIYLIPPHTYHRETTLTLIPPRDTPLPTESDLIPPRKSAIFFYIKPDHHNLTFLTSPSATSQRAQNMHMLGLFFNDLPPSVYQFPHVVIQGYSSAFAIGEQSYAFHHHN